MGKKKNFDSRLSQEKNEGLETLSKDIPTTRFQGEQQIQDTDAAEGTTGVKSSFSKVKSNSKGSVLKQEVASEVVAKGIGGSDVATGVTGTRTMSYSGNAGTVLGSAAYTPSVGQSRSDSRYGKKLDATAKKLNFIASEQVEEVFDESKPLAENPDSVQGYNGTYRNANARSQKVDGNVPGELMFQRSVDEIKRDQLYYSTGQVVKTNGVIYNDTPRFVPEKNSNTGVYEYPAEPNFSLNRGNYQMRNMNVTFNADGSVKDMSFDTVDLSTNVDGETANKASSHSLIDMNQAEMDRQIIDSKAGDEKADLWSPLARAVKEPTQTVGYLRDIENITGSEVFLAYKKTAACHSYQLNRAAKDGLKVKSPMYEALQGLISPEGSSEYTNDIMGNVFGNKTALSKGSAALMIAIYDSVAKYNTKADLLIQPRSFKMHLQTADNNMNPLRVKAETVQAINAMEVFSTIDRDYDPLMPVCISDKAALIHCYDFNDLYTVEDGVVTSNVFKYMYSDLRNNYVVTAALPLLKGLHEYLNSIGHKIVEKVSSDGKSPVTITIPMVHSTCFFSLWSLMVLAATPYILNARVNSLRDVLYYETNVEYPFHQLIPLKDANPMNNVNFVNDDYSEPLKTKTMLPSTALTWYMPELFYGFDEKTADDAYSYILPWYFNQEEFDFTVSGASLNNAKSVISMPSIRSGARFSFLDNVYSMEERDIRLCLDRLVGLPEFTNAEGNQGVYKYSQTSDGIPFVTMGASEYNYKNFLSLPRELGAFIVAPIYWLSVKTGIANVDNDLAVYAHPTNEGVFGQSSYMIKFWHGRDALSFSVGDDTKILESSSINVNRSTAYLQDWDTYHCDRVSGADALLLKDFGWLPSVALCFNSSMAPITGRGAFAPFTNGVSINGYETPYTRDDENMGVYGLVSLQKAIWARIQKLPFAISPFDCCAVRGGGEDASKIDPFDFLYYFGLAGFRGSDYREDTYNRLNQIANQGFTFLRDPFVSDSPIFRDAKKYTESTNADSTTN